MVNGIDTPAGLNCSLEAFVALVEQQTSAHEYRFADHVEQNVIIYRAERLRDLFAGDPNTVIAVRQELANVLADGPGIFVIKGAFSPKVIDRASAAFEALISSQQEQRLGVGDHYAKPGANDRVWNAIEKMAVLAPDVFVDYYSNDMVALGALAWLGPFYQISAQINVVNPGGEAQRPHRDYHLGFMTDAVAEQFPAHAHRLSPVLTLQGAVAHCDMPTETGPTMYLPHSQKYRAGYLAWRRQDFIEYFRGNRIQLPLQNGDLVYFSPALFHAAGSNQTADIRRMANLLQISSAMGRTMETIDRLRMTTSVYPALQKAKQAGMSSAALDHVVAACAEGYAFPTNLDNDPPIDGLTPPSQQELVKQALYQDEKIGQLVGRLEAHRRRQQSV